MVATMQQTYQYSMTARRDGTCPTCGGRVIAGESEISKRDSGWWGHTVCPTAAPVVSETSVERDAREMFGGWLEESIHAFVDALVHANERKRAAGEEWSAVEQANMARLFNAATEALRRLQAPPPPPVVEPPMVAPTAPVATAAASTARLGYFTAVAHDGTHRTIRVNQDPQRRYTRVAMLTGSANESDYTVFANVMPDGSLRAVPWMRGLAYVDDWCQVATAVLSGDLAAAGLTYALESGRCYICGRRLTVPASINAGIGPECAAKGGC